MRTGFAILVVLVAGALSAHFVLADTGYVLINFRGWIVEMSVPVLVLLAVLAYLVVRLLVQIWKTPRRLGQAWTRARIRYAGRQATRGYIALAEGKLARGERLLTRGARRSETPLLNFLAAARAAQMQGDRARRDSWLGMAAEHEPAAIDAVLLTQAELQLEDGQYEAARTTLAQVRERHPAHPQALKLLGELHFRRGEWQPLVELLPLLRRRGNVPAELLDEWSVAAYASRLGAVGNDRATIDALWDPVPRALRRQPRLAEAHARALLTVGAAEDAEEELRSVLRESPDDRLVDLYGQLRMADPAAHLKRIEAWLRERPEDPVLLLAAGRTSVHHQLWGKARSYLESSIAIRPTPEAWHALGELMTRLGDGEAASRAFEKGLAMSRATPQETTPPALPRPALPADAAGEPADSGPA